MLKTTDIIGLLNVHGNPPTSDQISELRRRHARSGPLGEDSLSHKVMMYSPPVVDIFAAIATASVEAMLPDPVGDLLENDVPATRRDWGSGSAAAYVEKVRASGRPLVAAEVSMLSSHRSVESHVATAVGALGKAIFG